MTTIKQTGVDRHAARLKQIANTSKKVTQALYAAGQLIETSAEKSITDGSISGKGHIPSAPGQPPNADTRHLDSNIETKIETQNPPTVTVTSYAEYSAALEFGTSRMIERPFMRPATNKHRKDVARLVAKAVSIAGGPDVKITTSKK